MSDQAGAGHAGMATRWHETPLYLRIVGALFAGVLVGILLGPRAGSLELPARLILRLLGALAPPLILVAVVHALMNAPARGRVGVRLAGLLLLNTLVAILIGLTVANLVEPGRHGGLVQPGDAAVRPQAADPWAQMLDNIPTSLLKPLVANQVIGIVFLANGTSWREEKLSEKVRLVCQYGDPQQSRPVVREGHTHETWIWMENGLQVELVDGEVAKQTRIGAGTGRGTILGK